MTSPQQPTDPGSRRMFVTVRDTLFPSRRAPSRSTTQAAHVRDRKFDGKTAAMAAAYNVSPRTVQRWIAGTRAPRGADAERLRQDAADVQTTRRGRERRARKLEGLGINSGFGAHISRAGTFLVRGSDAVRQRDIKLTFTGKEAALLARGDDEEAVMDAIGAAIARYFNGDSEFGQFDGSDFTYDPSTFTMR